MRTMLSIVASLLTGYLLICLLAYLFQSRLVFFPVKQLFQTPAAAGLDYEDIRFTTGDGIVLHGWFIPRRNASASLLFCHGNAGNISHRMASVRIFHDLGLEVFIFDYRGYGLSEGTPDETGTYLDARAAWDYLVREKRIDGRRIIIFGRSLGGAIAAHLGRDAAAAGIIIESGFQSIPELGQQLYPFLPVKLLSRIQYPTGSYLKEITLPKLIIHSRDDEIIPFSHGLANFQNAPPPKSFLEISGSHNDGFRVAESVYETGIRQFVISLETAMRR